MWFVAAAEGRVTVWAVVLADQRGGKHLRGELVACSVRRR
jgi:hypothetical protein